MLVRRNQEAMDILSAWTVGGSVLALSTTALLGYKLIRPRYPTTVECWFCGEISSVPYDNWNSWDCPKCEQYNGFSSDGDYNKYIEAQFCSNTDDRLVQQLSSVQKRRSIKSNSLLCESCNKNQQLKILQLANFVPFNEIDFDKEAEAYRKRLDHVYQLCRSCSANVKQELERQDAQLKENFMDRQNDSSEFTNFTNTAASRVSNESSAFLQLSTRKQSRSAKLLQICSMICALVVIMTMASETFLSLAIWSRLLTVLPRFTYSLSNLLIAHAELTHIIGTFICILAVFAMEEERRSPVDVLNCSSWIVNFIFIHFIKIQNLVNSSPTLVAVRFMFASVNLILSVFCIASKRLVWVGQQQHIRYPRSCLDNSDNRYNVSKDLNSMEDLPNTDTSHEDMPYKRLATLRLGTPKSLKNKSGRKPVFDPRYTSPDILQNTLPSSCDSSATASNRPLLSPPKFLIPSSKEGLGVLGNDLQQNIRHESRDVPVQKTEPRSSEKQKLEKENRQKQENAKKQRLHAGYLVKFMFGVSLGMNAVIVAYFLVSFDVLQFRISTVFDSIRSYLEAVF